MTVAEPLVHLVWRPATGEQAWRPVREAPALTTGFTEGVAVEFRATVHADTLLIDDEPLGLLPEDDRVWTWCPGFFAGEVRAELVRADRVLATFALDVTPSPGKLGRDTFRQMVDELWEANPALILGEEPATTPVADLGALADPWIAFARLRRYAPYFLRALHNVRARPRRRLRRERADVPVHRVRHVDRTTAIAALTSSAGVLLRESVDEEQEFRPVMRLDVPVVEETFDCAPNRTLLALARGVLRRAESLLSRLGDEVARQPDSETRSALAPRWPVRRRVLVEITSELRQVLRRLPFTDVTRAEITAAGLTAVAADPTYARAWACGWRAMRPAGDGDTDRLWISPTWEIYERWCFLHLGSSLAALPGWDWRWTDEHRRLVGRRKGRNAELLLQPTFRSSPTQLPGFWSVSRQREPDIVLKVDGGPTNSRFLVLDAKYRTSREAVLDAMASAHIYQDSLRLGDRRPEASLLLVPAGGGAPWLEADSFHERHRVGVHVLRPGALAALPPAVPALLFSGGPEATGSALNMRS